MAGIVATVVLSWLLARMAVFLASDAERPMPFAATSNRCSETVVTMQTSHEADIVAGLLRSHGIEVVVLDSFMARIYGDAAGASAGHRVQVPADDLDVARQIVQGQVQDPEPSGISG